MRPNPETARSGASDVSRSRRLSAPGRAGFTLIELLAVIVIISMLLGIAITAAQWVFRTARVKRYEMTCRVLEVAINRYRHEYRAWPIPDYSEVRDYVYKVEGPDNAKCLHMLHRNHPGNKSNIQFLDEASIFVAKEVGGRTVVRTLAAAGVAEPHPFVYRNKSNQIKYFTIEINTNAEKVKVE